MGVLDVTGGRMCSTLSIVDGAPDADAPKISAGLIVSVRRNGVRVSSDDTCFHRGESLFTVTGMGVVGLCRSIAECDAWRD